MKKLKRLKTATGSVLLTVVMVMFIMVMFLMSTLVLTNSANRRSFYTYFQTQAQFAAQAALDSVTNNAYSSKEFYDYVDGLNGATDTFRVYFEDNDIPLKRADDGKKYVECTISPIDEANYVWDNKTGKLYEQPGWKITAVAEVGTGKNTVKKSVVNYIYSNVIDKDNIEAPKNEWDYTYNLSVEEKEVETKTTKPGSVMTGTEAGLIQLSNGDPGAANDNMDSIGGNILGGDLIPDGRTKYSSSWTRPMTNDATQAGNWTSINANKFGDTRLFFTASAGRGIRMYSNVDYGEQEAPFYSSAEMPATGKTMRYADLPYFFAEGKYTGKWVCFGTGSPNRKVKNQSSEGKVVVSGTTPVVVHLGAIDNLRNTEKIGLYGDLYLHDPALTSNLKVNSGSYFLDFVSNQIQKENSLHSSNVNGNFVCNNKELEIQGGEMNLHGDFLFTNPDGVLKLGATLNIDGAFVTVGNVEKYYHVDDWGNVTEQTGKINAKNGVFILDGKTVTSVTTEDGRTNKNAATIESIGFNDSADNAEALLKKIKEWRDGYPDEYEDDLGSATDYSLFPYYARLDEIFDEYVRWDLCGNDYRHGFSNAEGDYDGSGVDDLMKESMAAGHTYKYVMKKGNCSTADGKLEYKERTYLATKPNSATTTSRGKNAFIPAYNPVAKLDETEKTPATLDEFIAATAQYGRGLKKNTIKDIEAPQTVNLFGHDTAGKDIVKEYKNASVINTSGVYRLKSGGPNYVFIDPYQAEHATSEKPMVLAFCGGQDATQIEFVVNNSAQYHISYDKPFPYASNGGNYHEAKANQWEDDPSDCESHYKEEDMPRPSRKDVLIYFMGSGDGEAIGSQYISVIPSGAYAQVKDGPMAYTVNVEYPDGTDNPHWNTLSADKRYKYEMIPNTVIYLPKGNMTFYSSGDRTSMLWGAVLASETSIWFKGSQSAPADAKFEYRVDLDQKTPVYLNGDYAANGNTRPFSIIGSLMCQSATFENWKTVIYGGPVTTSSGSTEETKVKKDATSDEKKNGAEDLLNNVGGNYFGNDHMGEG